MVIGCKAGINYGRYAEKLRILVLFMKSEITSVPLSLDCADSLKMLLSLKG